MNHFLNQITKANQGPSQFLQSVWLFINSHKGWLAQKNANSLVFYYFIPIDQFQARRSVLTVEERKNSYKLTITSQISIQGVQGGLPRIIKIIDTINSQLSNDLTTYAFSQPNLFIGKLILEKDTIIMQSQAQYLSNLLSQMHTNFTGMIHKIICVQYQQLSSMKKMRDIMQIISISKVYFDYEIKKREQCKVIDSQYRDSQNNNNQYFIIDQGRYTLGEDLNKLNSALRKIKEQQDKSLKGMLVKPLVYRIKMINELVDQTWKAPTSSYGYLEMVKAEYIVLQSFNNDTVEMMAKQYNVKERIDKRTLIRKNCLRQPSCSKCIHQTNPDCNCQFATGVKSFETEVQIIMYIRFIITQSIAQYFVEQSLIEKGQISNLYSKFYSKCLSQQRPKAKYFFPFLLSILQGLRILNNNFIIHRDLKPSNIMMDSKITPKIIDFGSAYQRRNHIPPSKISQQLITTRKYNLFYEEAIFSEKNKVSLKQFEQHQLFDMHAFGIILRQLYTDPMISCQLGQMFLPNLNWLSVKCCTHNPNLRMNHQQVFYFVSLLYKVWILKQANF